MGQMTETKGPALKVHNAKKKRDTVERVETAIEKLKKKNVPITFEIVAKTAGVSRATLYNHPKLKERIMGLRTAALASSPEEFTESKKTKVQRLEDNIVALKARVRQLEADKKNLIVQLVDYEEVKAENGRLKRQIMKGVPREE